jgi:Tfp pilus assembly protein PilO
MRAVDIACIIVLFLAVGAGGVFIQQNFSQNSSYIKLEKEQLLIQKNNMNIAIAKLEQHKSQFKEKEGRVLDLNKRVPKTPMMGELLSRLHALVKKRDITLIDFNHKPAQKFESYKIIPVQISVAGDFLNIYRLIHDLETLNRVFIFEKVMIKRDEEKNLCQAMLLASVFQQ